jgi:CheY-like chemotaxis protein
VREAGARAAALTRQLLAFGRRQVTAPIVLDVSDVVRRTEKMLRRLIGEDVTLVVVVEETGCIARLDPGQLEQVILNLALNARDAMPHGGTLTIHTGVVDLGQEADPLDCQPGKYVFLTVTDTGGGMTAAVRGRIFEPFFTTKAPGRGTGLGLATVYGIVKQSGGGVAVESEPGLGTTFRVYVPFVDEPVAQAARPRKSSLPRGSETILLVEDEPAVRNFTRSVLERCGYRVLAAADASEAIDHARQHDGSIDLLFSDVVMPGAGGRVVAEQVAILRPGVRVLFMSGYVADPILMQGVAGSEIAFLPKPFLPHELANKVRGVLDAPPAAQGK